MLAHVPQPEMGYVNYWVLRHPTSLAPHHSPTASALQRCNFMLYMYCIATPKRSVAYFEKGARRFDMLHSQPPSTC